MKRNYKKLSVPSDLKCLFGSNLAVGALPPPTTNFDCTRRGTLGEKSITGPKKKPKTDDLKNTVTYFSIKGYIKRILFPKKIVDFDGFAIVELENNGGTRFTVKGRFPFLSEVHEYSVRCVQEWSAAHNSYSYALNECAVTKPAFHYYMLQRILQSEAGMSATEAEQEAGIVMAETRSTSRTAEIPLDAIRRKGWWPTVSESHFFRHEYIQASTAFWEPEELARLRFAALENLKGLLESDPKQFFFRWVRGTPDAYASLSELSAKHVPIWEKETGRSMCGRLLSAVYFYDMMQQKVHKKRDVFIKHESVSTTFDLPFLISNKLIKICTERAPAEETVPGGTVVLRDDTQAAQLRAEPVLEAHVYMFDDWLMVKERTRAVMARFAGPAEGDAVALKLKAADVVARMEKKSGNTLSDEQFGSLMSAVSTRFHFVSGLAGTGKTEVARAFAQVFKGEVMAVAAYGKVAVHLRKITSRGSTIHGVIECLEKAPSSDLAVTYRSASVLVVDEMPLVPLHLFVSMLEKLPNIHRVLMIGDPAQMGCISKGSFVHQLLDLYAGTRFQSQLSRVFRVDPSLGVLLDNCNKARQGLVDFEHSHDLAEELSLSAQERVPHPFVMLERGTVSDDMRKVWLHYRDMTEVQVVTQTLDMTKEINRSVHELMKEQLGAAGDDAAYEECRFYVGEKILFKTNYREAYSSEVPKNLVSSAVMNGDTAVIVSIEDYNCKGHLIKKVPCSRSAKSNGSHRVLVCTDKRRVNLSKYTVANIARGYCSTVASMQGSEAPVVVYYIQPGFKKNLTKQEFYTAITRARKRVVLFCEKNTTELKDIMENSIPPAMINIDGCFPVIEALF